MAKATEAAMHFRYAQAGLKRASAAELGASVLDTKSKAKFADMYDLNFPLLASGFQIEHPEGPAAAEDLCDRARKQRGR